MAYDDTHCPCGGHKLAQTLLCSACIKAAEPKDLALYNEGAFYSDGRRAAAIRLVTAAGKRNKRRRALA